MSVSAIKNRKLAKRLRREQTPQEHALWRQLRAHRFAGFKFRRQHPFPPYVLDFVCISRRLVVELDGGQHTERSLHDRRRDAFLESHGFRVLRFWNDEVDTRMDDLLEAILRALSSIGSVAAYHPLPHPLPPAGEGAIARHS